MIKIGLKDIVIKSPGVQIRDKILAKYGTIKAFADDINLYESSINQYLSSKGLGSSTFKIRTTNAFQVDFHDLYKSDEEQLRYLTTNMSWYIDELNKENDIKILEKLKKLVLERDLMEDYAIICRCYAYYYLNQGKRDRAYAYMEVAVNYMRDKLYVDRFGLYLSDLISMKAQDLSKTLLKKLIAEFKETVVKVEGPLTKGHMYFNLGRAYFILTAYDESKACFHNVLNYHHDDKSISFVYLRLAEIEKNLGNYEETFNYCKKAENLLDTDDVTIYYVYNEYASYYINKNMYDEANVYTDKIFSNTDWQISSSDNDFLVNYSQIKRYLNKDNEIYNVTKRLLSEIKSDYIYTIKHLAILDEIIGNSDNKISILEAISKEIINCYENNNISHEYQNSLKRLLGSITINLHKINN